MSPQQIEYEILRNIVRDNPVDKGIDCLKSDFERVLHRLEQLHYIKELIPEPSQSLKSLSRRMVITLDGMQRYKNHIRGVA